MATRGVYQLQKLTIYYCEVGGSSRTLRSYIGSGPLIEWANQNPQVKIEVVKRNNKHPHIRADYLTSPKDRNLHQISVKNFETHEDITHVMDQLKNRSGRKIKRITNPVITQTPSIQGVWTPFLNLSDEPPFDVTLVGTPDPPPKKQIRLRGGTYLQPDHPKYSKYRNNDRMRNWHEDPR